MYKISRKISQRSTMHKIQLSTLILTFFCVVLMLRHHVLSYTTKLTYTYICRHISMTVNAVQKIYTLIYHK